MIGQQGAVPSAVMAAWRRPRPSIVPIIVHSWQWLDPGPDIGLLWDSSILGDGCARVVQELLRKALKNPLLPSQQQQVFEHVDNDPELLTQLQPQQLPALIEHNPNLACQLLLRSSSGNRMREFEQVLAGMPLSLHSMEVVNRLTLAGYLSAEVVHLYISNCIHACDSVADMFLQLRLARLVCVFLQSLVRQQVVDISSMLLEVQAFCIKFSRMREAATLFRVLKQIESEAGSSCSSLTLMANGQTDGSSLGDDLH